MCPVQLCRARTENRFFGPARISNCWPITFVTDDRPFWSVGRRKATNFVNQAGWNAGHVDWAHRHALRRSTV